MASTPDGPRYVASLQDVADPVCYKDFFEGEKQEEAKEKAEAKAQEAGRSTLVYDRKAMAIIHKVTVERADAPAAKVAPVKPSTRGKKRKSDDAHHP
jgi:hypothetical protein